MLKCPHLRVSEKLSQICRGAMRSYGYVNKQQQHREAMQQLQLATWQQQQQQISH